MKHIAAFLFLLAQAFFTFAQTPVPELIQDIHVPAKHPFEYMSGGYPNVHGKVIFEGRTTIGENGIWSFDGHIATMIDDYSSGFMYLAQADNGFFFIDAYDTDKYWLWKHDGSSGISHLIDDFTSSPVTAINEIAALHEKVFYRKVEPGSGLELWCATGSPGSGILLKDCNPGPAGSAPFDFVVTDSLLYFRAGTNGKQLWRSNGTPDGTFLLLETNISEKYIYPGSMKAAGNRLYFLVKNSNTDEMELWKSDGTQAGTAKATEVPQTAQNPWVFRAFTIGDKYFFNYVDNGGELGWVASDGTAAGTETFFDVANPGSGSAVLFGEHVRPVLNNEFLFFLSKPGDSYELWKSDGTSAGTTKIKSIDAYLIVPLQPSKHLFFFLIQKDNGEIELWASDGTETGTYFVKFIGASENDYIFYTLPCGATDSAACFQIPFHGPMDPFLMLKSDGTEQGTFVPDGIPAPVLEDANPSGFVAGPNDAVFFRANTEYNRQGIWKSDALPPFTATQLDSATLNNVSIAGSESLPEKVFWFINDTTLSATDASAAITKIPLPVHYNEFNGNAVKSGILYFLVDNGDALWRSDGTPAGTYEVVAAPVISRFYGLMASGDSVFFLQRNTSPSLPSNQHLWTTDGTAAGTLNLGEISNNGSTLFLHDVNDRLAYSTYDLNPNARTLNVSGFPPVTFTGLTSNEFAGLEIIGDQLFILGPLFYNGTSLEHSFWVFQNGQLELLQTFSSVLEYSFYNSINYKDRVHGLGQKVIFGAGLTTDNVELWTSDGTPGGTYEIRDLNPAGSSDPDNFVRFDDNHWLFTAFDGTMTSWWATDGTWDGTFKVADLAAGTNYLVPNVENAYLFQNRLYFSMNDGVRGQEPWVMVLSDSLTVGATMPLQPSSSLALWPNPASDMLYLSVETATDQETTVEISNNQGEVVHRQQATIPAGAPLAIPLDKRLVTGVYVVRVSIAKGESWVRKFVLSR